MTPTMIIFLVAALLAGCGPYRAPTDPDAMSEAAHRERAASLSGYAAAHERRYDGARARRADTTHGGYGGLPGGDLPESTHATPAGQVFDSGAGHVRAARRLRALSREHEAAADALVALEASECAGIAPEQRAACPLAGAVQSTASIEGGVALELRGGVDPTILLEHVRCHVAFARRHGRSGMDGCPLYVDGVRAELSGAALVLTTASPAAVEQLRERAERHLPLPADRTTR